MVSSHLSCWVLPLLSSPKQAIRVLKRFQLDSVAIGITDEKTKVCAYLTFHHNIGFNQKCNAYVFKMGRGLVLNVPWHCYAKVGNRA